MREAVKLERWENWEKFRSKGFARFLLEIGFLRFGLPVTLLFEAIDYLFKFGLTSSHFGELFTETKLVGSLIYLAFESLFFGTILWVYGNRKFPKVVP